MNVRFVIVLVPLLAVLACETATNLDVSYAGADASTDASDVDGGPDGSVATNEVEGCPCDTSAGLGCCVTAAGAYCTNNLEDCTGAKGTWLRCAHRDAVFESECCWNGSGVGAQTRFAVACDGGPAACLTNADCTGTNQPCSTVTCAGFTFGQCAATPPACPTP